MDEEQTGIKNPWRNVNNVRNEDDTTLMAETEELTNLLIKMKEESEKVGLKLNIQTTKIMVSGPITSRQIDGEILETARDFILGGSKMTADDDFSHEIKRCLLLGRKTMIPRQHIKKKKTEALLGQKKVFLVKTLIFFSISHAWMGELDYKDS